MVNTSSLSKLSQRNDRSSGKMSRESKKSVTKNIEKSQKSEKATKEVDLEIKIKAFEDQPHDEEKDLKSPETPSSNVTGKSKGLQKTHASTTSSKAKSSAGNATLPFPNSDIVLP